MLLLELAVIGDPIGHTLSPVIHKKIASQLDSFCNYTPYQIQKGRLESFVELARQEQFSGFNVTIPHKSDIIPYLDKVSSYAQKCGAVNTVVCKDGKLYGYNTDGQGFYYSLLEKGVSLKRKNILLLGSGGAAQAVCQKCLDENACEIVILCRHPQHCNLQKKSPKIKVDMWSADNMERYAKSAQLIINCTPLGMEGIKTNFEDFHFLNKTDAAVCDIVYKPLHTSLLREASSRGLLYISGIGMLIYQAIFAFSLFADIPIESIDVFTLAEEIQQELNKYIC